jgi:hypothetical protein
MEEIKITQLSSQFWRLKVPRFCALICLASGESLWVASQGGRWHHGGRTCKRWGDRKPEKNSGARLALLQQLALVRRGQY